MAMTFRELRGTLAAHGIENAAGEALLLLSHTTGLSDAALLAAPDASYDSPALQEAVEKRIAHYPLQYILGTWEFMGLSFFVNEDCLIPRPDTEILAEEAIRLLPPDGRILDLCTGSGCILAAVLAACPRAHGVGVEKFPRTLAMAQKNIDALGLSGRARLLHGDVCGDVLPAGEKFSVITANPPYICAADMASLAPELAAEPRAALTDEGDGLSLYRAILALYPAHLAPDGVMLLEHGASQAEAVAAIGASHGLHGYCLPDYGGHPRCTVLRPSP